MVPEMSSFREACEAMVPRLLKEREKDDVHGVGVDAAAGVHDEATGATAYTTTPQDAIVSGRDDGSYAAIPELHSSRGRTARHSAAEFDELRIQYGVHSPDSDMIFHRYRRGECSWEDVEDSVISASRR